MWNVIFRLHSLALLRWTPRTRDWFVFSLDNFVHESSGIWFKAFATEFIDIAPFRPSLRFRSVTVASRLINLFPAHFHLCSGKAATKLFEWLFGWMFDGGRRAPTDVFPPFAVHSVDRNRECVCAVCVPETAVTCEFRYMKNSLAVLLFIQWHAREIKIHTVYGFRCGLPSGCRPRILRHRV